MKLAIAIQHKWHIKNDFAQCFHPQPIYKHHLCLLSNNLSPSETAQKIKSIYTYNKTQKHASMPSLVLQFFCRYKFWLTNGEPWDFFHYHFSADEFYILPILMVSRTHDWHLMIVILLFWQRAIQAFLWHIEQVYGVFNLILLILTFKSAIQVKNTELCLKEALIQL